MTEMQKIREAADYIRARCGEAEIGLVLGSGLGNYGNDLPDAVSLPYAGIPHFPNVTVPGHAGKFIFATIGGRRVCLMSGRFHYYEGHDMAVIIRPVRVMKLLGVNTVILTNAAGGVNTAYRPGDLMLISDFINLCGASPLRGDNCDELGPRFPDMSDACSKELRSKARACAEELGMHLQEGVYCMMSGPAFESKAEIRMTRVMGADAVGMSTVPEIMAAVHAGMRVLGISCITNMAAGVLDQPITHSEVIETGKRVEKGFSALMTAILGAV